MDTNIVFYLCKVVEMCRLSMDRSNKLTVMATTLIKKGKPIKYNYVKVQNLNNMNK
jgi:hypothetical protein